MAEGRRPRKFSGRHVRPGARCRHTRREPRLRRMAGSRHQRAARRRMRTAGFDVDRLTEVGEVLSGTRPGRQLADELTVYKATGHAVEDVAAARLVYDRARAEGVGIQLP